MRRGSGRRLMNWRMRGSWLAEGKPGVAKIYFQMAAKHASGDVKQQALAELESLNQPKTSVTVSGQATAR